MHMKFYNHDDVKKIREREAEEQRLRRREILEREARLARMRWALAALGFVLGVLGVQILMRLLGG